MTHTPLAKGEQLSEMSTERLLLAYRRIAELEQQLAQAQAGQWLPVESIMSADKPEHLYTDEHGFSLCDDDGAYQMEFRYDDGNKYSLCRWQAQQRSAGEEAVNMSDTLAPCPFCGHEGNEVSGEPGMYEILCDGCDHASFAYFHTKAMATAAWNTRVAAPAVTLPDEVIHAMKVFAYPGDELRQMEDLWIAAKILRVFLSKMKGGSDGTI